MTKNALRYIQIGTEVELDDGKYLFVEEFGGKYKFRNLTTGGYHVILHTELPGRLKEMPTLNIQQAVPVRADGSVTKEMAFLAAHLQEVIDGTPITLGGAIRPEYDPEETTYTQRMKTKAHELSNVGLDGYSYGTLRRKMDKYRVYGITALVDQRVGRKEAPLARVDERIKEALAIVMARETHRSTGNLVRLSEELDAELAKRHPGAKLIAPPPNSLRRYVNILDAGRHTLGSAKTRQTKASAPQRMFRPRPALLPGVEMQIDATQMDILTCSTSTP